MYKYSLIVLLAIGALNSSDQFERTWGLMQQEYAELKANLLRQGYDKILEKVYYHPHWEKISTQVQNLILGSPDRNYLKNSYIQSAMVRDVLNGVVQYEENFLKNNISNATKHLIRMYKEPEVVYLTKQSAIFNCSANALGQLFYVARILENTQDLNIIVEFGSGYGCQANIFKQLLPQTTLVLIDIPEFLALQFLYLSLAMPQEKVILHKSIPHLNEYESGMIHLIPIFFIKDIQLKADLFTSTFALSETPRFLQNLMIEQKFFNAHYCYLVGQMYQYNKTFEDETMLRTAFSKLYTTIVDKKFHIAFAHSYEVLGSKK